MITDLDGGGPAAERGRANRAVSIALVVAALVAYGALTWLVTSPPPHRGDAGSSPEDR